MRVVVVDDDQLVAISLKTILEAATDMEVVAMGNDGKEAVELYEKYQPEVLLMDIQMKTMSGLRMTTKRRRTNENLHRRRS